MIAKQLIAKTIQVYLKNRSKKRIRKVKMSKIYTIKKEWELPQLAIKFTQLKKKAEVKAK